MKGSFRIARLFGIPVHVHWTFFLIFVYIYLLGISSSSAPKLTGSYMILILMLFVCVLLHEFGHALTARRFGVSTHDIILSPIGGIARLSKLPEKPIQEFLVAIAGPAVNLVIALCLAPLYYLSIPAVDRNNLVNNLFNSSGNYFAPELSTLGFLVVGLFWLNIVLAIFNLLPAFPMDGGRVLRALLSLKLDRVKATRYAALIGKLFSILFIVIGLLGQPMNFLYVFIGLFIFMTASNEYRMVKVEKVLKERQGKDMIRGTLGKLYLTDKVGDALEVMEAGLHRSFVIVDSWQNPLGILTEKQILQAVKAERTGEELGNLPLYKVQGVSEESNLNEIYRHLSSSHSGAVLLMDRYGNATGVIDTHLFNQFLRAQQGKRRFNLFSSRTK